MSKEKMSLAEARERAKWLLSYPFTARYDSVSINIILQTLLEATEPKYISGTNHVTLSTSPLISEPKEEKRVYWFDKRSPYDQLDNLLSNISPQDWEESEQYSKNYDNAAARDKAREEWIKSVEKKPLFTFEGNEYFEGDKCWWFKKATYEIVGQAVKSSDCIMDFQPDSWISSKIYPTRELCQKALEEWVYNNHKLTLKECEAMHADANTTWKDLIKQIINI